MKIIEKWLILALAQGLFIGRIPFAPGTWGSLLGLAWFAALLSMGNLWVFLGLQVISFAVSIWACGKAEHILMQHDPGSVVLDEIVAIPLCFTLPILLNGEKWLDVGHFFGQRTWWLAAVGFTLFRLFDIWKPTPIRTSQVLPGGLGITVDDLIAGVYVSVLMAIIMHIA